MQTHAQAFFISVCLYAFLTGEGDKMEIKYKFTNGEVVYVEVSDEMAAVIEESRRLEENGNRKERYHCYSLESMDYEGEDFADTVATDDVLLHKESESNVERFMSTLTLIQRRRLEMRLEGKNIRQIAQAEKADYKSVKETFLQIQKKFKLFFKIPPPNFPLKISV